MKIFDNGEYRKATPDKIAELEAIAAAVPPPEPTDAEKIAALLAALEGGLQNA
jgi:hypothetical protein|nr:MAG TPA: hypothetical protein [Caudoviricetes sp.]